MASVEAKFILASGSPRRQDIIGRLGLPFVFRESGLKEELVKGTIRTASLVERLACLKARQVVGCDTLVFLDGDVLGKPADAGEARQMLLALRGRSHTVVTAVAVLQKPEGKEECLALSSQVRMADFSEASLNRYLESGDPLDKAGAYGIQNVGGDIVESFSGCYLNIVGLPLCNLVELLARFQVAVPSDGPICTLPNGQACFHLKQSGEETCATWQRLVPQTRVYSPSD